MRSHSQRRKAFICLMVCMALFAFARTGKAAPPDEGPTVIARVRILKQESPLQILGVRFAEETWPAPYVHFRNNGASRTSRIWVEAVVNGSKGRVTRISSNSPNELWPAERSIDPGADGWAREIVLSSNSLIPAGARLHSNCVLVDILIVKVDFEDGTSWRPEKGKRLEGPKFPEQSYDGFSCGDATASQNDLGQLVGATLTSGKTNSSQVPSGEVQSYEIRCSLHSEGGRKLASCPY